MAQRYKKSAKKQNKILTINLLKQYQPCKGFAMQKPHVQITTDLKI